MTSKELFQLWAPDFRAWSAWAKPVLFVGDKPPDSGDMEAEPTIDVSWAHNSKDTFIVVDLPGALSVRTGVALVSRGFWPVPLFNSAYNPIAVSAVRTGPIRQELWDGAVALGAASPDPNLPPAFLLDSNRVAPKPDPGEFDNRWLTFPQDFPSANLLLSRGLINAIIVQDTPDVRNDLAHVLRRWQDAGIQIAIKAGNAPSSVTTIAKPTAFRSWLYVALTLMNLRPNSAGGFGSIIPIPGSGGGFVG
jgi:hypothetical protein